MSLKELEERLETVENAKFMLAMKDNWSSKDYETNREYNNEISELNNMIDAIKKGN